MAVQKDDYWFRHDANARFDSKLIKLRHKYDFWGIGVYWCVIEVLRSQPNYTIEFNESEIALFSQDLVRVNDVEKFQDFILFCVEIKLFFLKNGFLTSVSLKNRMKKWESSKKNGSKGGRPSTTKNKGVDSDSETQIKTQLISQQLTQNETQTLFEVKPNRNHNRDNRDNITEKRIIKGEEIFEVFRKKFPGNKDGHSVEFNRLRKKHSDWSDVIHLLGPALDKELTHRDEFRAAGQFVAQWKNLSTWLNNRCWEQEFATLEVPSVSEKSDQTIGPAKRFV